MQRPTVVERGKRLCGCGKQMVVRVIDTHVKGTQPVDLALCEGCDGLKYMGYR